LATSPKGPESRHDQIKEHEPGLALAAEEVEVINQVGAGSGDAWSSGRRSAGGGAAAGFGSQICGAEERRRDLGLLVDRGWVRL